MVGCLTESERRALRTVIERYDLEGHRRIPILQLAKTRGWIVQYDAIDPANAYAIVANGVRLMVINENLCLPYQRAAIAHEMGHVILGHQRGLNVEMKTDTRRDPIYRAQEAAAELAAALLLLPDGVFSIFDTPETLARTCQVPLGLVQLRLDDFTYRMNNEHTSRFMSAEFEKRMAKRPVIPAEQGSD